MEPLDSLKYARMARREALASVARRTGVAERLLRAIEEGRFECLPPGIYGRGAIRSYAAAFGLDAAEILAACGPLLPAVDDPISAMGRLRGVRSPRSPEFSSEPPAIPDARCPDWRLLVASVLDAGVIGAMLVAVIGSASIMSGAPPAALDGSAAAFGLMGVLLGSSYFLWLGGLAGTTVGTRGVGLGSCSQELSLNLRAIATRAVRSATDDLRFIRDLGVWFGRLTTNDNVNPHSTDSPGNRRTVVARS